MTPRNFMRLTDRQERLRLTRWEWFATASGPLALVRLQSGMALVIELTAALQFVIFLSLPTQKQQSGEVAVNKVRWGTRS